MMIGKGVCHFSTWHPYNCAIINWKWFNYQAAGSNPPRYYGYMVQSIDLKVSGGDSGGSVQYGNAAFGLITAECGNPCMVFMPINRISALGLGLVEYVP
jgi:hypothetical protein